MFYKWLAILLGGLVVLATAQDTRNYAVAELRASGVSESDAAIITERLRSELLTLGKVRVMERSEMALVLQEQSFQQSGVCDQSSCALEIGKILSVDRMVVGSMGRIGALYTLSVRVLNVETGEIVQSFNVDHRGNIEDLVQIELPKLAMQLAQVSDHSYAMGQGALKLESEPSSASVYVNSKYAGKTPLTLDPVPAGVSKIEFRKDGYASSFDKVKVEANRIALCKAVLKVGGYIGFHGNYVTSAVLVHENGESLDVELDGIPVWISEGKWTLMVEDDDFEKDSIPFMVLSGARGVVQVELNPRKARVEIASEPKAEIWNGIGVVGNAPWTSPWLEPGKYEYTLRAAHYLDTTVSLDLVAGMDSRVQVKLKPTEEFENSENGMMVTRLILFGAMLGSGIAGNVYIDTADKYDEDNERYAERRESGGNWYVVSLLCLSGLVLTFTF